MVSGETDSSQGKLIIASQYTGALVPVSFDQDPSAPSVNIKESNIHLQNAAYFLARISMINGMEKAWYTDEGRQELIDAYRHGASQVVNNTIAKRPDYQTKSKRAFAEGFGLALVAPILGEEPARQMTRDSYEEFKQVFNGSLRPNKNLTFRQQLESQRPRILRDQAVSRVNREEQQRPHEPDRQLDTQQRLLSIQQDVRAGFLPTTSEEKNRVLTFLDYMDNPQYPLGINDQLYEVFMYQAKANGLQVEGIRAMRSITYELTDFLNNANTQLMALQELAKKIADCPNPNAILADEIGETDPGYAPLIRYMDIKEFMLTGKVAGLPRKPLRTRQDREGHNPMTKRKTVEDQYTAKNPKPLFAKRIAVRPSKLTIGAMRGEVAEAIDDQEHRLAFMYDRLQDTATLSNNRRDFLEVRRISRVALEGFDEVA